MFPSTSVPCPQPGRLKQPRLTVCCLVRTLNEAPGVLPNGTQETPLQGWHAGHGPPAQSVHKNQLACPNLEPQMTLRKGRVYLVVAAAGTVVTCAL